jgi:hypothetical protein
MFSLIFYQALFMFILSSKLSKAANLYDIHLILSLNLYVIELSQIKSF